MSKESIDLVEWYDNLSEDEKLLFSEGSGEYDYDDDKPDYDDHDVDDEPDDDSD